MRQACFILLPLLALRPSFSGELADQLCSSDPSARETAVKLLAAQGGAALPELVDALGRTSPGGRLAAVHLLSRIEGPEARDVLAQALSQESAVAFSAAVALAMQGDARGEGRLRDALAASQPLIRVEAGQALAALGSAAAVPDLIRGLEDEDERVRAACFRALLDLTLQDFDYNPENPAHALPREGDERQALEEVASWKAEQLDLLKEGKYKYQNAEGREILVDAKNRAEGDARIKREAAARWNEVRRRGEAQRLEVRAASVAQWRAWWEEHREEGPSDWLKGGLLHDKPSIRSRAAAKVEQGELEDFIPALVEALSKEGDVGAAEGEARALASFHDKGAIEPLVAYLDRMKERRDVVAVIDVVLGDLTGIRGVPPSGRGWGAWWRRVSEFYERGAVKTCGGMEYAVHLRQASEAGCTLEVRRWLPERSRGGSSGGGDEDKGSWLAKTFELKAGEAVGEKDVETLDRFKMPVKVDLTPGLTLERIERDVRIVRRRPLKREGILRAVLKETDGSLLTLELPVS